MAFRLIPAGSFRMGSRGYYADEEPIHTVIIPQDFWLAETPVTQTQFDLWTKTAGVDHKNHFDGHPDHPAENLDWRQANAFCAWLTQTQSAHLPLGFSLVCLPTEAEWEYACRAGTETEYYTGDGEAALMVAGWFGEDWDKGSTHPVGQKGQKSPNAFQVFDLHGNVWEWCHDRWDASAYRQRGKGKPDPGFALRREEWSQGFAALERSNAPRVLRGGSWGSSAGDCRSAFRFGFRPDVRDGIFGFRVCLVRGPADSQNRSGAEPVPGDAGRGTRPESDGPGGAREKNYEG
jgi:formylglycine-generating enzyme required for sulfatase activity